MNERRLILPTLKPQLSPLAVHCESAVHLRAVMRHMREPVVVLVALQTSPLLPPRHRLVAAPVQGLGLGTQALVSAQTLSAWTVVQLWWGRTQVLEGEAQVFGAQLQQVG